MTDAEMKTAAALLRLAAESFRNHGCNDFDLTEVLPDPGDRQWVLRRFEEHAGTPEYYDPNDCDNGHDARLMDFFADELDEMAGWCPSVAEQAARTLEGVPHA